MKKAPGILPSVNWLLNHGEQELVAAMSRHPEAFAHIKQNRKGAKGRTPREWVCVAKRLMKEHGGVLPNSKWLQENGYGGLNIAMRKHPHLFKHIKQNRKYKKARTPKEWIRAIERLAKKHGGVLPNCTWLMANGYSSLYAFIRKHPHLFKHIKQDRKYNKAQTLEEWIHVAERLAKEHGGVLPNCQWLRENGYGGLSHVMRKHPHLFQHIKQARLNTHGQLVQ